MGPLAPACSNFHTAEGRSRPLADLIRNDGRHSALDVVHRLSGVPLRAARRPVRWAGRTRRRRG